MAYRATNPCRSTSADRKPQRAAIWGIASGVVVSKCAAASRRVRRTRRAGVTPVSAETRRVSWRGRRPIARDSAAVERVRRGSSRCGRRGVARRRAPVRAERRTCSPVLGCRVDGGTSRARRRRAAPPRRGSSPLCRPTPPGGSVAPTGEPGRRGRDRLRTAPVPSPRRRRGCRVGRGRGPTRCGAAGRGLTHIGWAGRRESPVGPGRRGRHPARWPARAHRPCRAPPIRGVVPRRRRPRRRRPRRVVTKRCSGTGLS